MGVSSVDRSRDDKVRQTREEAEERESNLLRRKNSEIKRAEKRHQAEVQNLKDNFQREIDDIKSGNRESLTARDQKNNEKIEKMRNVYSNQMRKKMEDSQFDQRALRDGYENEIQGQKKIFNRQRANIEKKQNEELNNRDAEFANHTKNTQSQLKEAIDKNRKQLNDHHEKEKGAIVADRERLRNQQTFEKEQMRDSFKSETARQKRDLGNQSEYWRTKYEDEVHAGRASAGADMKMRDQTLKQAVNRYGEKYQTALQAKQDQITGNNENFKEDVNNRVNTQIRSKNSEIHRLKNQLNTERVNSHRQKELEKGNLMDAYEKQLDITNQQKETMKDEMLGLAHERTNKALRKQENEALDTYRSYKSQMSLNETKQREDRKNLINTHDAQLDYVRYQADKRVEKMNDMNERNQNRLTDYFNENVTAMKDNFQQKLTDQRDASIAIQGENTQAMQKRFRNIETTYQQRIDRLTSVFENKINQMKDDHSKELRRIEAAYQQRMTEREKGFKNEKTSLEQKYETKLTVAQEQTEQRIDSMSKRHDEELKSLAQSKKSGL